MYIVCVYIYIYIYMYILRQAQQHGAVPPVGPDGVHLWVFITGGCSRMGVQCMGVALYNNIVYNNII